MSQQQRTIPMIVSEPSSQEIQIKQYPCGYDWDNLSASSGSSSSSCGHNKRVHGNKGSRSAGVNIVSIDIEVPAAPSSSSQQQQQKKLFESSSSLSNNQKPNIINTESAISTYSVDKEELQMDDHQQGYDGNNDDTSSVGMEDVVSVLMDLQDDEDEDQVDDNKEDDVRSVVSLTLPENTDIPRPIAIPIDEKDDDELTQVIGAPSKLHYSPESESEEKLRMILGVADPMISHTVNFPLIVTNRATTKLQNNSHANDNLNTLASITNTNEPSYDIDRFFPSDCESFLEAAEEGDIDEMRDIANRYNAYPVYKLQLVNYAHEEEEYTALHLAGENGWLDIVEFLIGECGMTATNRKNVYGCTAFHLACIHAHTDQSEQMGVINYLLQHTEIFIDDLTGDGMTALHSAAKRGNMKLVRSFVEALGADYALKDDEGCTPLYYAALYSGKMEVINYLVSLSPVISEDTFGRLNYTYLHIASMSNKLPVVKYFIDNWDVNPHITDGLGRNSLHCAAEMGSCDIMKYLADPGTIAVNVNVKDVDGHTPLHHVAHDGRLEMVKYFVEQCGADVYVQNKYGKTPRHQTCSIEVAVYLDSIMSQRAPPPSYLTPPPIPAPGTGTGSRFPDHFPFYSSTANAEENEEGGEEEEEEAEEEGEGETPSHVMEQRHEQVNADEPASKRVRTSPDASDLDDDDDSGEEDD